MSVKYPSLLNPGWESGNESSHVYNKDILNNINITLTDIAFLEMENFDHWKAIMMSQMQNGRHYVGLLKWRNNANDNVFQKLIETFEITKKIIKLM